MAKPLYLSDDENNKILADYMDTHNYSETGRKFNVSDNYVMRLVKKNEDIVKNCLEEKKQENIKSTLEYMKEQNETKKRLLDKLLKGMEVKAEELDMFTNIKDLATAYGIILDKELKLKEIEQKLNENTNFDSINSMITNIANLINNPVEDRTEDNIDKE